MAGLRFHLEKAPGSSNTQCGCYVPEVLNCARPEDVTCKACKRTVRYRQLADAAPALP
jgi:hypothetical protein